MEHNESTSSRDIAYAIRTLSGVTGLKQASFMTANVDSVQEADRTISATIILGESGMKLTGVNLQSEPNDGFILIPKVDTDVLICLMPDNSAYMVLCNDIDKIICVIDSTNSYEFDTDGFIWNGGNNDGLVKVIQLTQKLNALENKVNSIIATYNAHTHVASSFGSPTTTPAAPIAGTLTPTQQTDIENPKIKH